MPAVRSAVVGAEVDAGRDGGVADDGRASTLRAETDGEADAH